MRGDVKEDVRSESLRIYILQPDGCVPSHITCICTHHGGGGAVVHVCAGVQHLKDARLGLPRLGCTAHSAKSEQR